MSRVGRKIAFSLCLLLLSLSVPAGSQVQNASLTGSVTDPSGAVVPNASVTATQTSTNLEQKTTTDSAGYYLFPALLVGTYTVAVEAPVRQDDHGTMWIGAANVATRTTLYHISSGRAQSRISREGMYSFAVYPILRPSDSATSCRRQTKTGTKSPRRVR